MGEEGKKEKKECISIKSGKGCRLLKAGHEKQMKYRTFGLYKHQPINDMKINVKFPCSSNFKNVLIK